jgi:hypothetical protein
MKRSELEIGGRYVGPGDKCYEIVDLSPGWRISGSGEWAEDTSTRTRHMPGRGETKYRANLSLKAYLVAAPGEAEEVLTRAAVDPRKLLGPWADFERQETSEEVERLHAQRLLTLLRRNLRTYPVYVPAPGDAYEVSKDGRSVTVPLKDLAALMDVAFNKSLTRF